MRLFVVCQNCERKYKTTPDKIGKRFRCHCGEVLEVREATGQDSAVIRCSSCGGAREKGSNRCGYCDADFTIHERDLHTVCPKCMTRVSDSSKFCRHCGTRLAGEQLQEEASEVHCPVCGPEKKLSHRKLGQEQVSVLECSNCAGLWLGTGAFQDLKQRVLADTSVQRAVLRRKPSPTKMRHHFGPRYRQCSQCGKHMSRQQYARGSGVVIDICPQHGIWFDAHELQQTLDWIARGGTRRKGLAPKSDTADTLDAKVIETAMAHADAARHPRSRRKRSDFVDDLISSLFEGVSGIFD